MNWLFKEEPSSYSFEQFTKDGGTSWAGVRNPLAQKHLRSVKKGDVVLYYHTGTERAVVGIARATSDPYADPKDKSGKLAVVNIAPVRALKRPVTLAEIKASKAFASFALTRLPRLSVMPVSDAELKEIEKLSENRD
jgi:predicted RNA-binding protein with PUA-like domain